MGWSLHKIHDEEWKTASAAAQAREDAIKAPGSIPKDQFWQPGEWGQWLEIEKKLKDQLSTASDHRDKTTLREMQEVMKSLYTPEAGGTLPANVINHVSSSIVNVTTTYGRLPAAVLAVTDEEKQQVLNQHWIKTQIEQGRPPPVAEAIPCQWVVSHHWYIVYSQIISGALFLKEEEQTDGLNRLIEGKRRNLSGSEMLAQEINRGVKDIASYTQVMKDLETFVSQTKEVSDRHIARLIGESPGASIMGVHLAIDSLEDGSYMTADTSTELKAFFDTEEKARAFSGYATNTEWSRDMKELDLEKEVLESLSKDQGFLGRWLYLVYQKADAEQTEKVRAVREKLNTLYSNGRHALSMNLV